MRIEYGGDAALCPVTATVWQRPFGDNGYLALFSQFQCQGQACQAAADDQNICFQHVCRYNCLRGAATIPELISCPKSTIVGTYPDLAYLSLLLGCSGFSEEYVYFS